MLKCILGYYVSGIRTVRMAPLEGENGTTHTTPYSADMGRSTLRGE